MIHSQRLQALWATLSSMDIAEENEEYVTEENQKIIAFDEWYSLVYGTPANYGSETVKQLWLAFRDGWDANAS